MSAHEIVNVPELGESVGYAHAVVASPGATVHLAGQTALGPDGLIHGETLIEQFEIASANVTCALRAADCQPEDLVSMQVFTTDVSAYKASLRDLARVWKAHFGHRYPAMGLFGVLELYDHEALVELMGVAVRPDRRAQQR